eukprot:TRINITY_DN1488_c0_g1_i1.p1 TRINITY_DN1488_c0_g1~~TRINITY_DN1488_c0_g1_i1.p1  ORF type:complete len:205 (-),score=3.92 TRINITY_DN1488_c0_g1_i1:51-629(-)
MNIFVFFAVMITAHASCNAVTVPAAPPPSATETAIAYGLQLIGAPYGWWTGGPIPTGPPAWAQSGVPPTPAYVKARSTFCAGVTNLMLRSVGKKIPGAGGTGAYGSVYASVAEKYNSTKVYPRGTLLGRYYKSVSDQGHVAVLLQSSLQGLILQSTASKYLGTTPGVTNKTKVSSRATYFQYAVLPQKWLGV